MRRGVFTTKALTRTAALVAAALATLAIHAAAIESQNPPRLGGPLIDGSVIRTRGCGTRFFIAYRDVFVLAEWLGGEMIKENDVLQGTDGQASFEREGRMTFTNLASGRAVDIVIEKTLMNHSDYARTLKQVCG
jgi:hypothetical protein